MSCNGNGEYTKSVNKYLTDIEFSHSFNPKRVKKVRPGHLSSVLEQQKYAERQLHKAQKQLASTPACRKTEKLKEEVWAWEIFSQTVLPMLSFLDD
jgi:hypothetical protein